MNVKNLKRALDLYGDEGNLKDFFNEVLELYIQKKNTISTKLDEENNVGKENHYEMLIDVNKIARAVAPKSNEYIKVLKGSFVSKDVKESLPISYKTLRQDLEDRGIIKEHKFTEDFIFGSFSGAAGICKGYSINGRNAWKIK